jgi:hypothetical protein
MKPNLARAVHISPISAEIKLGYFVIISTDGYFVVYFLSESRGKIRKTDLRLGHGHS